MENDRYPNTAVAIKRYRLDSSENPTNPEWEYKGQEVIQLDDCDEGLLPVQTITSDLNELSVYRFSISYINAAGESVESDVSNQVRAQPKHRAGKLASGANPPPPSTWRPAPPPFPFPLPHPPHPPSPPLPHPPHPTPTHR